MFHDVILAAMAPGACSVVASDDVRPVACMRAVFEGPVPWPTPSTIF